MSARAALRCTAQASLLTLDTSPTDELEEWQHPPGRDPRGMTVAELTAIGHPPISRAKAIRQNCIECCCGNAAEVARCHMLGCPMWPFRMGTDPYRAKQSERQRAARVASGLALAARRGSSKQPRAGAGANKP
jgi:hypothetical protein